MIRPVLRMQEVAAQTTQFKTNQTATPTIATGHTKRSFKLTPQLLTGPDARAVADGRTTLACSRSIVKAAA